MVHVLHTMEHAGSMQKLLYIAYIITDYTKPFKNISRHQAELCIRMVKLCSDCVSPPHCLMYTQCIRIEQEQMNKKTR